MKLFLMVFILSSLHSAPNASASAPQCPKLAGTYTCLDQKSGDKRKVVIEQKNENGFEQYLVPVVGNPDWVIASGKKDGEKDDYVMATCVSGTLKVYVYNKQTKHETTAIFQSEDVYTVKTSGVLNVDNWNRLQIQGQDLRSTKKEVCSLL